MVAEDEHPSGLLFQNPHVVAETGDLRVGLFQRKSLEPAGEGSSRLDCALIKELEVKYLQDDPRRFG